MACLLSFGAIIQLNTVTGRLHFSDSPAEGGSSPKASKDRCFERSPSLKSDAGDGYEKERRAVNLPLSLCFASAFHAAAY